MTTRALETPPFSWALNPTNRPVLLMLEFTAVISFLSRAPRCHHRLWNARRTWMDLAASRSHPSTRGSHHPTLQCSSLELDPTKGKRFLVAVTSTVTWTWCLTGSILMICSTVTSHDNSLDGLDRDLQIGDAVDSWFVVGSSSFNLCCRAALFSEFRSVISSKQYYSYSALWWLVTEKLDIGSV